MTLSPLQERSIAHATARINIWEGAVRSGKTVASLLRWLTYVAQAPPGALIVTGRTLDSIARNVFMPMQDPALFGPAAGLVRYTRGATTAQILDRPVEVIGASDAKAEAKLRGMTAAGAYVDEITVLPEAYWTQLLARLSVPGAKLFGTTNPDSPRHWLRQKYLLRADVLNLRSWPFRLEDNPALDPAYVEALRREYVGLWHRRMILGEWVAAEGAVYDMLDEARHIVAEVPDEMRAWLVGIDYGTSNPTHAVLVGLGYDGVLYAVDEWRWDARARHRALTDVELSRHLRAWLADSPAATAGGPAYVVVDPSAASLRVQLHRDGVRTTPADNDVVGGIRTVASLLAVGALRIHRRCAHLLDELAGYAWDDRAAERGEDAPLKADDHGPDALRYAIHTTRSLWRAHVPALTAAAAA